MASNQLPFIKERYPYATNQLVRVPVYFDDLDVALCSNIDTCNAVFMVENKYGDPGKNKLDKFLDDMSRQFGCIPCDCLITQYNRGLAISLPFTIDRYAVQSYFAGCENYLVRAFSTDGVALIRGRPITFRVSLTLHSIPPDIWAQQTVFKLLTNMGSVYKIDDLTICRKDRRQGVDVILLTHDVYSIPQFLCMHYSISWADIRVSVHDWHYYPEDITPEALHYLTYKGRSIDGNFKDDAAARASMLEGADRLLNYWVNNWNDGEIVPESSFSSDAPDHESDAPDHESDTPDE